ncbi:MAG: hypothetical protein AAGA03_20050, partial [Planctomycetota bacterium]
SDRAPENSQPDQRPPSSDQSAQQRGGQPSQSEQTGQQQQSGQRQQRDQQQRSDQQPQSGQQQPGLQQQPGQRQQPGQQQQSGRQQSAQSDNSQSSPSRGQASPSGRPSGSAASGLADRLLERWGAGRPSGVAPISGEGFREWSDRLRDVEQMVQNPELRSDAARIRDRARDVRREQVRQSKEPNWSLVEEMIASPLRELKLKVSEELMRRTAEESGIVPLDRDPVPPRYIEAMRTYYENLGSQR